MPSSVSNHFPLSQCQNDFITFANWKVGKHHLFDFSITFSFKGVTYSDEVITAVSEIGNGDLRRSINFLQSLHAATRSAPDMVTARTVRDIAGIVPQNEVLAFIDACSPSSTSTSTSSDHLPNGNVASVCAAAKRVVRQGYAVDGMLAAIFKAILANQALSQQAKARIALVIAEADFRLQVFNSTMFH